MREGSLNISERLIRLIVSGVLLLLFTLPYVVHLEDLPLPTCLFKSITNLSCPTCGVSRAFFSTAQGSIGSAMQQNFVGLVIFAGLLLYLFKYVLELIRGQPIIIGIPKIGNRLLLILFFSGWFSFWFIRLLRESI